MNILDFLKSDLLNDVELTDLTETLQDENSNLLQSNSSDTLYLIVLYILITTEDYNTQKLWESYAEEIKRHNRYFPESDLLKIINEAANKATTYISKGEILYRAREYSRKDLWENPIVRDLMAGIKDTLSNSEFDFADINNQSAMYMAMLHMSLDEKKRMKIANTLKSSLKHVKDFYGFDEENSDAPPSEKATEGRANPKGISYLYATKDVKTAVLELRPQMGKDYSVATIEMIDEAKVYDLTRSLGDENGNDSILGTQLHRVSEEFSKPNMGDTLDYVPTQYLCEYIKKLGFDGLIYKSAVSATGKNVLLFNTDVSSRKYHIIGSKLYRTNAIEVDISQMLPIGNE